jgi:hypothetical protein
MSLVYEVTIKQNYFGQSCVNRFNYVGTGTPISVIPSFALLSAMGLIDTAGALPTSTLGGDLQDTQPDAVTFVQALARTVTDENPTDFYDYPYPAGVIGTISGQTPTTPINAFGFFTNRVRVDIARGTKRFVGVTEEGMGDGGELESAFVTALNALASDMSDVLTYTTGGESLSFAPCVAKRVAYTTPSGKTAYKYYDTQAEQLDNIAQPITWQPYPQVRSQVSRQYKPS